MRLGRGDRRNANRLTIAVICLIILMWILQGLSNLSEFLTIALIAGGFSWIFYMAVEPYFRRRWPQILVSWTRILSKEWKDPLVGRDIFIGCGFGVLSILLIRVYDLYVLGSLTLDVPQGMSMSISGARYFVILLLLLLLISFLTSYLWGVLLLLTRVLLRSDKVAFSAVVLVLAFVTSGGNLLQVPFQIFIFGLLVFALMRFGLLVIGISYFIAQILAVLPTHLNPSAFYLPYSYAALAILGLFVIYSFRTSLGGRPLFGTPRLDD